MGQPPVPFGTVSRRYGRDPHPICRRCKYRTHPIARTADGERACTHCIKEEETHEEA